MNVTAKQTQYRKKIHNVSKDKKIFSRTAGQTQSYNQEPARPMRGGIRL